MEIKTINMKFTKPVFDELKYKKGKQTWEAFLIKLADIKDE